MRPELDDIVALSRYYGRDPEWVIAGGGNSSVKNASTLMVKASGTSLATASSESFVAIDRNKLAAIWSKEYPDDVDRREAEALEDLMECRFEGESLRPSVETGMHDVFPQRLVFHTHPTVVNGLTCGVDGEAAARELFGDRFIWIPSINPGYVLSKRIQEEIASARQRSGEVPQVLLLQNHGLTVAGESREEIHRLQREVTARILARVAREPDLSSAAADLYAAAGVKAALATAYEELLGKEPVILFEANREVLDRSASEEHFAPAAKPFSPDHIVYAGHAPLYVSDEPRAGGLFKEAYEADGVPPKCIVVRNLGLFNLGPSLKAAESARMLFRDALKVARFSESFGGPRAMSSEEVAFIRGWEVEKFRASVSLEE